MKKGNIVTNWNSDYVSLQTTYEADTIKSRDSFYQNLGYEYVFEDIIKNIKKPIHEIKRMWRCSCFSFSS